jgi:hypothetical protein
MSHGATKDHRVHSAVMVVVMALGVTIAFFRHFNYIYWKRRISVLRSRGLDRHVGLWSEILIPGKAFRETEE